MYPRTQRKKRTESMEATAGEHDLDDDDENDSQVAKGRQTHQRKDLSTTTTTTAHHTIPASLASLAVPVTDEHHHHRRPPHHHRSSAALVARLLHDAELSDLVQLEWSEQIKFFLSERSHLLHQLDFIRTQFEKQYTSLKRRLDETETENERLTAQHRSESKQLLLYKNLLEAPENTDSTSKTKDYQQLRSTIETVLKENERLHGEIHDFKTSDPVYEQVQLLETANKHLKQELQQLSDQYDRLKRLVNFDEIKHIKSKLTKSHHECEKFKSLNRKLANELEKLQQQSPKQVRVHPYPQPSSSPQRTQETYPSLTIQNLRQFDINSHYPLPSIPLPSPDILELKEHVQLLEQKLQQRDYELQTLQLEIEKGTSSIMSSIEDLYIASSSVSPTQRSPMLPNKTSQPTIEELQNELDQLHDKLDELTRENQTLKNRTQEFDTIYEENEYLYAEKSQWNEELERARIRELILEQEIRSLKEREKEFLVTNDHNPSTNSSSSSSSNITQLKLKIDWLHQTNNQLELEIVRLREQIDLINKKSQEYKKDLISKDEHYKQLLVAVENKQQLPQELIRLEKLKIQLENQLDKERQEHEQIITKLEEQNDKREQKYSSLYDAILKLQNDYRQRELDYVQQMEDIIKQRDDFQKQLTNLQEQFEEIQQENKALKEEIKSKDEINRDLKLALTTSNNDAQTVYNQLRQLNINLTELQEKYDHEISKRDQQIERFENEHKKLLIKYDEDLSKTNQTIVYLQEKQNEYLKQIETYRSNLDKIQIEFDEKQNFIEQIQSDLSERSAVHSNINNQLSQENKIRISKITELEQALVQEQQRKNEVQRTVQDLQVELVKSHSIAKEALEKSQELERRLIETDKQFEETIRTHFNETTQPTRRELNSLRTELVTKSDQITQLQNAIDDEKLKRQRLEMKLKRLKDEYINVRKELYSRIEENNTLQHELVECRFKNDYNLHITNQTFNTLKSPNESESSTTVQLYLKEKTENQHWQLKCRTYQQKYEQLQKNYDLAKDKYKQRLHEERDMFERTKTKYLDHIKNVQKDLQETRLLLEKDSELKSNQETAYQQLIDERRQLLTSMVDKDAKVREMRRENLLLTSKIQLLEDQMENLNDRVDRTLRERNQLRREINNVRFDSSVSIETNARTSSSPSSQRATNIIETATWTQPVHHKDSFGFDNNGHPNRTSPVS